MKIAFVATSLITLGLSSSLSADDINPVPTEVQTIPSPKKERQVTPAARPQIQGGINLYLTGDWLYFKPQEKGLSYALKATANPVTVSSATQWEIQNGEYKSTEFCWQSGFRVGAGWNTKHDDWDFLLSWTHFYTSEKDSTSTVGTDYVFPSMGDPSIAIGPVQSASADFCLHLNQLELILGREFYVSRALSLKPKFGVITAWIDQKYDINYDNSAGIGGGTQGSFNDINNKCDFWGTGLKAGLNTQWELGWGFSIFGDGAFSILYGKFNLNHQSDLSTTVSGTPVSGNSTIKDKLRIARYIADLGLGLRWDYMFMDDRVHLGLSAGWKDHMYFGQNQFLATSNARYVGINETQNEDLTLQGFVLGARIDF